VVCPADGESVNGYKWGECIPLKYSPPHWEREGCQDWVCQQKVRSRGREIDVFQHFVDVLVGDLKVHRSVSWALSRMHSMAKMCSIQPLMPQRKPFWRDVLMILLMTVNLSS